MTPTMRTLFITTAIVLPFAVWSHPSLLPCSMDNTTFFKEGHKIMHSKVRAAKVMYLEANASSFSPSDPIEIKVGSHLLVEQNKGLLEYYLAIRIRDLLQPGRFSELSSTLNMTANNCTNQAFSTTSTKDKHRFSLVYTPHEVCNATSITFDMLFADGEDTIWMHSLTIPRKSTA
eukprot:m.274684 g.274684  ORF g.274684 m.274684 type:complete len:175 (-) comp114625_c0_seq1:53-577(-)